MLRGLAFSQGSKLCDGNFWFIQWSIVIVPAIAVLRDFLQAKRARHRKRTEIWFCNWKKNNLLDLRINISCLCGPLQDLNMVFWLRRHHQWIYLEISRKWHCNFKFSSVLRWDLIDLRHWGKKKVSPTCDGILDTLNTVDSSTFLIWIIKLTISGIYGVVLVQYFFLMNKYFHQITFSSND